MITALAFFVGGLVGALVMAWCAAAGNADGDATKHADVDALAKMSVRAARVEANYPPSDDEHAVNLGT